MQLHTQMKNYLFLDQLKKGPGNGTQIEEYRTLQFDTDLHVT